MVPPGACWHEGEMLASSPLGDAPGQWLFVPLHWEHPVLNGPGTGRLAQYQASSGCDSEGKGVSLE